MNSTTKIPRRLISALIGVLILVALDQLSKWWVLHIFELPSKRSVALLPFLNFTMVWNEGISMGLAIGDILGPLGITILTGLISVGILIWLVRAKKPIEQTALTLVLGGAIGNLIDRFLHGAVVDFVHLHAWDYHFYVFNLADSAITIGVILLLIDSLRGSEKHPKKVVMAAETDAPHKGDGE